VLFSFNDEFIAAVCGGLSDEDTVGLFGDGIEAMIETVEEALERTVGYHVPVHIGDQELYVDLDEAEAELEFGTDTVSMQPKFRQAFAQASQRAGKAFEQAIDDA
jgi:accessory colonization factor AcfC